MKASLAIAFFRNFFPHCGWTEPDVLCREVSPAPSRVNRCFGWTCSFLDPLLFEVSGVDLATSPMQNCLRLMRVVHLVSRAMVRQFREVWCDGLQTQTLLPSHPTDHPFFPNVGGYWSMLYSEELQAPQGRSWEEDRMPGLPSLHQQSQPCLPSCTN